MARLSLRTGSISLLVRSASFYFVERRTEGQPELRVRRFISANTSSSYSRSSALWDVWRLGGLTRRA